MFFNVKAIDSELKDALEYAADSNVFPSEFLKKFEVIKIIYSTAKYGDSAREKAIERANELRREGWLVKVKKISFEDLARETVWRVVAVRYKVKASQNMLEIGKKMEQEHKPTVEKIKQYFKKYNEFPPEDKIYEWIALDHINEYSYYYDKDKGLPKLEKELAELEKEIKSELLKTNEITQKNNYLNFLRQLKYLQANLSKFIKSNLSKFHFLIICDGRKYEVWLALVDIDNLEYSEYDLSQKLQKYLKSKYNEVSVNIINENLIEPTQYEIEIEYKVVFGEEIKYYKYKFFVEDPDNLLTIQEWREFFYYYIKSKFMKQEIRSYLKAKLVQRIKDGVKRWALISRGKKPRVLKWFGKEKPSKERVAKEEKRIQYFKHLKSSIENEL